MNFLRTYNKIFGKIIDEKLKQYSEKLLLGNENGLREVVHA